MRVEVGQVDQHQADRGSFQIASSCLVKQRQTGLHGANGLNGLTQGAGNARHLALEDQVSAHKSNHRLPVDIKQLPESCLVVSTHLLPARYVSGPHDRLVD